MPESTFIKKISDRWLYLIGDSALFSLEARIYHSISIALVLLAVTYAPYNFFEGLVVAGTSAMLLACLFFYQYYNSRFRNKAHSNVLFALTGIFIFSVNYFSNSGIDGSTDIIWPVYLLLVLAITPRRQHLVWIAVYIISFFVLHVIEYHYPALVKHPFDMGRGQFIDRITAFPLPVITISIIMIFIRRSYDTEKAATEEKAATIAQQKNELEKSNAEKNKLLSIISHDMRAPFSNIRGYLQLLNENKLNDEERMMAEGELLNATDQTMEMLSNLLYWSQSQIKGIAIDLVKANLYVTIYKTIDIEKKLAAKKNITLIYRIDAGIRVTADTNMLQLVIRNIISNAIKFTHEGGRIDIDAEIANNECKITITDNGVGIDFAKRDTLFSMTSSSTFGTNNEKGVGLGLPLCKEFMELQHGRILLESTPGKGSSFYIFVPLSSAELHKA